MNQKRLALRNEYFFAPDRPQQVFASFIAQLYGTESRPPSDSKPIAQMNVERRCVHSLLLEWNHRKTLVVAEG
jgi:hypothetical protein